MEKFTKLPEKFVLEVPSSKVRVYTDGNMLQTGGKPPFTREEQYEITAQRQSNGNYIFTAYDGGNLELYTRESDGFGLIFTGKHPSGTKLDQRIIYDNPAGGNVPGEPAPEKFNYVSSEFEVFKDGDGDGVAIKGANGRFWGLKTLPVYDQVVDVEAKTITDAVLFLYKTT